MARVKFSADFGIVRLIQNIEPIKTAEEIRKSLPDSLAGEKLEKALNAKLDAQNKYKQLFVDVFKKVQGQERAEMLGLLAMINPGLAQFLNDNRAIAINNEQKNSLKKEALADFKAQNDNLGYIKALSSDQEDKYFKFGYSQDFV